MSRKFQHARTGGQAQFEPEGPRRPVSIGTRDTQTTASPGSAPQSRLAFMNPAATGGSTLRRLWRVISANIWSDHSVGNMGAVGPNRYPFEKSWFSSNRQRVRSHSEHRVIIAAAPLPSVRAMTKDQLLPEIEAISRNAPTPDSLSRYR